MSVPKFIKCFGVSLAGSLLPTAAMFKSNKKSLGETIKQCYPGIVFCNLSFSTIPAAVANVIDAYGHQYVSSNQYIQYGLTALEGSVLSFLVVSEFQIGKITYVFENFIEPSMSPIPLETKALVIGAAAQAVAFKYILSDSEETPVELALSEGGLEVA